MTVSIVRHAISDLGEYNSLHVLPIVSTPMWLKHVEIKSVACMSSGGDGTTV